MIHRRRDTEYAEVGRFFEQKLLLCALRGREKKFKNDQNRKIGVNEIKHLQLLILRKRIFSHVLRLRGEISGFVFTAEARSTQSSDYF
jgi:hypothetical protein